MSPTNLAVHRILDINPAGGSHFAPTLIYGIIALGHDPLQIVVADSTIELNATPRDVPGV
jgi:hypothetical protein